MGIEHFENGRNRTTKYVDTGVLLNKVHSSITNSTLVTRSFLVPNNKKWTVSNIHLSREEPGKIEVYISTPAGVGVKVGQDLSGFDIFVQKNFTIGAGWWIHCVFSASPVAGNMYIQIILNEEPE